MQRAKDKGKNKGEKKSKDKGIKIMVIGKFKRGTIVERLVSLTAVQNVAGLSTAQTIKYKIPPCSFSSE